MNFNEFRFDAILCIIFYLNPLSILAHSRCLGLSALISFDKQIDRKSSYIYGTYCGKSDS